MRHLLICLIPFFLAGCFETREQIARQREEQEVRSNLQQNVMQAGQGLDKVQAEIGRLQGRVEEIEHQRKKDINGFASSRENEQKSTEKAIQELSAKVTAMQEAQNTPVRGSEEAARRGALRALSPRTGRCSLKKKKEIRGR